MASSGNNPGQGHHQPPYQGPPYPPTLYSQQQVAHTYGPPAYSTYSAPNVHPNHDGHANKKTKHNAHPPSGYVQVGYQPLQQPYNPPAGAVYPPLPGYQPIPMMPMSAPHGWPAGLPPPPPPNVWQESPAYPHQMFPPVPPTPGYHLGHVYQGHPYHQPSNTAHVPQGDQYSHQNHSQGSGYPGYPHVAGIQNYTQVNGQYHYSQADFNQSYSQGRANNHPTGNVARNYPPGNRNHNVQQHSNNRPGYQTPSKPNNSGVVRNKTWTKSKPVTTDVQQSEIGQRAIVDDDRQHDGLESQKAISKSPENSVVPPATPSFHPTQNETAPAEIDATEYDEFSSKMVETVFARNTNGCPEGFVIENQRAIPANFEDSDSWLLEVEATKAKSSANTRVKNKSISISRFVHEDDGRRACRPIEETSEWHGNKDLRDDPIFVKFYQDSITAPDNKATDSKVPAGIDQEDGRITKLEAENDNHVIDTLYEALRASDDHATEHELSGVTEGNANTTPICHAQEEEEDYAPPGPADPISTNVTNTVMNDENSSDKSATVAGCDEPVRNAPEAGISEVDIVSAGSGPSIIEPEPTIKLSSDSVFSESEIINSESKPFASELQSKSDARGKYSPTKTSRAKQNVANKQKAKDKRTNNGNAKNKSVNTFDHVPDFSDGKTTVHELPPKPPVTVEYAGAETPKNSSSAQSNTPSSSGRSLRPRPAPRVRQVRPSNPVNAGGDSAQASACAPKPSEQPQMPPSQQHSGNSNPLPDQPRIPKPSEQSQMPPQQQSGNEEPVVYGPDKPAPPPAYPPPRHLIRSAPAKIPEVEEPNLWNTLNMKPTRSPTPTGEAGDYELVSPDRKTSETVLTSSDPGAPNVTPAEANTIGVVQGSKKRSRQDNVDKLEPSTKRAKAGRLGV